MKRLVMFWNKKITQRDKLSFLEYLSIQVKKNTSYETTLVRYIENANRKPYIIELCNVAIEEIRNGKEAVDSLHEIGFIDKLEYGLIKNANSKEDLHTSLISIIAIIKSNMQSHNVLSTEIIKGVAMFVFPFILIPFFNEKIVSLYTSFADMQNATGDTSVKAEIQIPFLIKYWWSSFVFLSVIALSYFGIKKLLNFIYEQYSFVYYKLFKSVLYIDLISVLKTFEQLQMNMTTSNAYITLSESAPNFYWKNLFNQINLNLKQGGKASEIFVSQKGIIPLEVIECFVDADETGETELYIENALDYCSTKIESINKNIEFWAPAIIQVSMYLIVGYMAVSFMIDMSQNGVLNLLNKM